MMPDHQRQQILIFGLILFVGIGGWIAFREWIRPAAVEFDNLKYIQMLTTAVSNRNEEWVAQVEAAVQQQFDEKQMSAQEHREFQKIIALSRDLQWEQADRACFRLAEAQLSRRRSRGATSEHSHLHSDHSSGMSHHH
jgi:hypothetical protein